MKKIPSSRRDKRKGTLVFIMIIRDAVGVVAAVVDSYAEDEVVEKDVAVEVDAVGVIIKAKIISLVHA